MLQTIAIVVVALLGVVGVALFLFMAICNDLFTDADIAHYLAKRDRLRAEADRIRDECDRIRHKYRDIGRNS